MQKIYLEKAIDLNHRLKELIALSVDESINYKIENEGIRAVGNLIIKGEYRNIEKESFEQTLELDVLATFDKILDQRDFSIKVEDFDYKIKEGNIIVTIEAGVHGVVSGEDRYVENETVENNPVEDIEELMRGESQVQVDPLQARMEEYTISGEMPEANYDEVSNASQPAVEEMMETKGQEDMDTQPKNASTSEDQKIEAVAKDIDDQLQEVVYESKTRPIFQDTTDSVGTYYLYIVQDNDTYQSIAERYENDATAIKEYNQNRELEVGSVLIIPYAP